MLEEHIKVKSQVKRSEQGAGVMTGHEQNITLWAKQREVAQSLMVSFYGKSANINK